MSRGRLVPFLLLASWITLFGAVALGASASGFDDHPGQLYRLWLVVENGFAPWQWSDGWWAGYPELQFYPPGFAYAGALLHRLCLGALSVDASYVTLVWVAWAAPGVTTYLLLARIVGSGWAALPGAFVALTIDARLASGVEGGVHVGMVAARLAWAALPLLLWFAARAPDDPWRMVPVGVPLVALVVLTHPAHAPAAVAAIVLPALVIRERRRHAVRAALAIVLCAAALTAFWSLPLLVRIENTRALAWGSLGGLLRSLAWTPLALLLVALAVVGLRSTRDVGARLVTIFPWIVAALVAVDAIVLESFGLRWLPADRLVDSAALAVVLAAGVEVGGGIARIPIRSLAPVAAAAVIAGLAVASIPGGALTLWPKRAEWPALAAVERGLRLRELWSELSMVPAGRILFTRSGVPLVHGTEWWRPHTHATALTPRVTGRAIVHGTFTHPSPIAALVYRGDAGRAPVSALAETLDGRALFGRPLESLDARTFERYADRLGVSAVVALEDDAGMLGFLDTNPHFRRARAPQPFVLYAGAAAEIPRRHADGRWRLVVDAATPGAWTPMRVAYSPLWRVVDGETPLETRRGELGDLEARVVRPQSTITLRYAPAAPEIIGVAVSVIGGAGWLLVVARSMRRRRAQPATA